MAKLGRMLLPPKCGVLEGISSLKCPLFSHSYLPMHSSHSSLQIDLKQKLQAAAFPAAFALTLGVKEY